MIARTAAGWNGASQLARQAVEPAGGIGQGGDGPRSPGRWSIGGSSILARSPLWAATSSQSAWSSAFGLASR